MINHLIIGARWRYWITEDYPSSRSDNYEYSYTGYPHHYSTTHGRGYSMSDIW